MMEPSIINLPPDLAAAIEALGYDAKAERSFDVFAGGFTWSDELTRELFVALYKTGSGHARYLYRNLVAYRASLILGKEREDLRPLWNAMAVRFPSWPGLRPERYSRSLAQELEAHNDQAATEIDKLFRVCERAERIAAIREARGEDGS